MRYLLALLPLWLIYFCIATYYAAFEISCALHKTPACGDLNTFVLLT